MNSPNTLASPGSSSMTVSTDREILVHGGRVKYVSNLHNYHTNRVITSQYTWWNFLPKNIFIQFCNRANLYFLIIGIFQIVPAISTTNGIPTIYNPLLCIIVVGAVRAAMEDRARHIADAERNHAKFWRISTDGSGRNPGRDLLLDDDMVDCDPYPAIDWVTCGGKLKKDKVHLYPGEDKVPEVVNEGDDDDDDFFTFFKSKKTTPTPKTGLLTESTESPASPSYMVDPHVYRSQLLNDNLKLAVVNSGDLKVGSIVKVYKNQMIPCDMIFLGSSETRGHCFIDKANLNGETTLEVVSSPPILRPFISTDGNELKNLMISCVYESPSSNFEKFRCTMNITTPERETLTLSVNHKQLLLRETVLRNSDWIYGLAVYTGDDTKIRRSVSEGEAAPMKISRVMRLVDRFITSMFILQFLLCILGGVYAGYWHYHFGNKHWYLSEHFTFFQSVGGAVAATFSWMILLSSMVPISLVVSSQMVKFAQSWFIEWDLSMFDAIVGKSAKCNTSAIHEDLGQVDFIFSDKTGTLTQNKMEFRYGVIALRSLSKIENKDSTSVASLTLKTDSNANDVSVGDNSLNQHVTLHPTATNITNYGSIDTDIARAVKAKLNRASLDDVMLPSLSNISKNSMKRTVSKPSVSIPSTNPSAYAPLPIRWTQLILPIVKPLRQTSAIVDPDDLMFMTPSMARQKARLEMLKGGWAGRFKFSRFWHTSHGIYYSMFIHAKRGWYKYEQEHKKETTPVMQSQAELPSSSQSPAQSNLFSSSGSSAIYNPESPPSSTNSSLLNKKGSVNREATELVHAFSNDYITGMLSQTVDQDEEDLFNDNSDSSPSSKSPVHSPAFSAASAGSIDSSSSDVPEDTPPPPFSTHRKGLEDEIYVPLSHLGAFGEDERIRLLTTLWGHNWGDYSASKEERLSIMRYFRHLALSSTVKPFRRPDGMLDWQFESAEELAMVRVAAACGFVRDNHFTGNGTVLYIREYLSPSLTNTDSRIHTECYNNIATLGFTSKRARVSVVWQRLPYKMAYSSSTSYTPASLNALTNLDGHSLTQTSLASLSLTSSSEYYYNAIHSTKSLASRMEPASEGINTETKPSIYLMEYDEERITRLNMSLEGTIIDPSLPSGVYDNDLCDGVGLIHVMTKGQDAVMIPLLRDVHCESTTHSQEDEDGSVAYEDPRHPIQSQLRDMSANGLRVLVAAYAELPPAWWNVVEKDYSLLANLDDDHPAPIQGDANGLLSPISSPQFNSKSSKNKHVPDLSLSVSSPTSGSQPVHTSAILTSLANQLQQEQLLSGNPSGVITSKALRDALNTFIEQSAGLALLGCIAMEDKLQVHVPETIRDFSRAGIRVWMITGDKLDTARNIALACELVDADMVMSQQQIEHTRVSSINDQQHHHNPNSSTFLPLIVRASRGQRLLEVTADWLSVCNREPNLYSQVFDALDEGKQGWLSLGYLQRCLYALGHEITLSQLAVVLSTTHSPLMAGTTNQRSLPSVVNAKIDTRVSKTQFISALHSLADTLTHEDAVITDIEQSIDTYHSTPSDQPLSLLVNRDAFSVLFPPINLKKEKKEIVQSLTSPLASPHQPLLPSSPSFSGLSTGSMEEEEGVPDAVSKRFIALSAICKSVIFARAEPAMKKRIVTEVQTAFPSAVTVAIGDGANDTEMISAASLGIGLAGVEGTAASNMADYALCSFRMLHTLLFVHGVKSYSCISKLVVMMFYKASLLAWTNFAFGIDSSFTGQQWYNDTLYQFYNIIYTAWPVLILGVLDNPLPTAVLENSPSVYREVKGRLFSGRFFGAWMARSCLHSLYIYYLPWCMMKFDHNDIMGSFMEYRGKTYAFWYTSTLQLAVFCVLPNLMILYLMESVTIVHWVAVLGSSILIFVAIASLAVVPFINEIYGFGYIIFTDPMFWIQFTIFLALPLILDLLFRYLSIWIDGPTLVQVLKERIYLRERQYWRLAANSGENPVKDAYRAVKKIRNTSTAAVTQSTGYSSFVDNDNTSTKPAIYDEYSKPKGKKQVTFNPHAEILLSDTSTPTSEYAALHSDDEMEPCWSVQVMGPDPDDSCLQSPELFGNGAGWGVRATACEEMVVNSKDGDRSSRITDEAVDIIMHKTLISYPIYNPIFEEDPVTIVSRIDAARVLRSFANLHHTFEDGGFHSASSQKYHKRDKFHGGSEVEENEENEEKK